MGRAVLTMPSGAAKAMDWIRRAPPGTRITFQGPKRSTPQNDRMWAMLTAISVQLLWHGQYWPPEDWKDFFMSALSREKFMPKEEGGFVLVGRSTSRLSKQEHSDLTALIEAFAARHDVDLGEEAA